MKITVAGGICVDITGRAFAPLRMADSNPARLHLSPGGVGRNIAENLHRLGADVAFAGAVGDDRFAAVLRASFRETGMDAGGLVVRKGMSTGLYLDLLEPSGELFVAVNSLDVIESLAPEDMERLAPAAAVSALLVADANLLPDTLLALAGIAEKAGCPLMADGVSTFKVERLRPVLPRLALLKTNRAEAAVLAGFPLDGEEAVREGCAAILAQGVRELHITLGAEGSCAASRAAPAEPLFQPALRGERINVNGAGDAFAAGVAYRYGSGGNPAENARFGAACAAITIESHDAVSRALGVEAVRARSDDE